jgi:hypothetical protein
MTLQEIGVAIIANADQVVGDWSGLARRDPRLHAYSDGAIGELRELFVSLAEAALLHPANRQARLDLVWRAARHGQDWRSGNHPQQLLVLEHHLMQRALSRFIGRFAADSRVHIEAIARTDVATNLSMRAALHGYRRPEREAEGQWPQVIEMLAWEWMPPAQVP